MIPLLLGLNELIINTAFETANSNQIKDVNI